MKTKFDEYLTLARVTEARKNREVAVQAELDNLRIELQALKTVLDARAKPILEQCRIPVVIAIRGFNAQNEKRLGEDVDLFINHESLAFNVHTTLRLPNGREPYDSMDDEYGDSIAEDIRATVDRELERYAVPLTFGTVRFPGHYYIKLE